MGMRFPVKLDFSHGLPIRPKEGTVMKRSLFIIVVVVSVLSISGLNLGAETAPGILLEKANAMQFEIGKKAAFLGLFAYTDAMLEFPDKIHSVKQVIEKNPFIVGFTLKIQWKQFHPQPTVIDWDGLEELIDTVASAGKLVNICLIPGEASPEWLYDIGAKKIETVHVGRQMVTAPVPWDYQYLELYCGDLKRIRSRYGSDPRVWAVQIMGHNYIGEEMHAPAVKDALPFGWSEEKVLENWKIWIDFYDEIFPTKKLILVVSENYRGADDKLSEYVAEYFVNKCQGRAILMSHQLSGRCEKLAFGPRTCQKFSQLVPNCHELVQSLSESPERQGSAAMTVYNFVKCGNPLFLQLWRRDCDNPQYAKAILDAWNKYGWMPPEALKERLEREGLYVKDASPLGGE